MKITNVKQSDLSDHCIKYKKEVLEVLTDNKPINKQIKLPNDETEVMIVGTPVDHGNGAVFVYQSLDVIDQTRAHTTKIIFLAAGDRKSTRLNSSHVAISYAV